MEDCLRTGSLSTPWHDLTVFLDSSQPFKIAYMEHMLLTPFPEPCCVTMLLICTEREYKNNFFTNHCCVFWRIEFMASSSPLKFLRKSCKHFLLCSVCWENKYEAYLCLLHKTLSCVSAHYPQHGFTVFSLQVFFLCLNFLILF